MNTKYLFFLLIPAFFGLSSCANQSGTPVTDVFEFSNKTEVEQKIEESHIEEDIAEPEPVKEKKVTSKAADKVVQPEPVKEVKETKITKPSGKDHFIKRYNIGYLSFDVADFYGEVHKVDSTPEYDRYYFRFFSRSNAFMDYLFGWRSNTVSVFRMNDEGVYPETFQTKVVLKKKTREMEVRYDASGRDVVCDQVTPPDNRAKRPAVPANQKKETYDFLSIVFEARRLSMNAFKENHFNERGMYSFTLPLYDGRRRSNINFTLHKKKKEGLYHLSLNQKPVAGYTNNEWAELKKGQRTVDIYIDPKEFWPVSAVARSPIGSAKAHFVQNCKSRSMEKCIKLSEPKEGEDTSKYKDMKLP